MDQIKVHESWKTALEVREAPAREKRVCFRNPRGKKKSSGGTMNALDSAKNKLQATV